MKHLRQFENTNFLDPWTEEKFEKLQKAQDEISKTKRSLYPLLANYIKLHPELTVPDIDIDWNKIVVTDFYIAENVGYKMEICYKERLAEDDFQYDVSLNNEEFKDLLIFLENPDVYINAKKYNL